MAVLLGSSWHLRHAIRRVISVLIVTSLTSIPVLITQRVKARVRRSSNSIITTANIRHNTCRRIHNRLQINMHHHSLNGLLATSLHVRPVKASSRPSIHAHNMPIELSTNEHTSALHSSITQGTATHLVKRRLPQVSNILPFQVITNSTHRQVHRPHTVTINTRVMHTKVTRVSSMAPFIKACHIVTSAHQRRRTTSNDTHGTTRLLARARRLLLNGSRHFIGHIGVTHQRFNRAHRPFHGVKANLLTTLTTARTITRRVRTITYTNTILIIFPARTSVTIRASLSVFSIRRSHPFAPVFHGQVFQG